MWIEVFRAGQHTASDGQKRSFSIHDLDAIVRGYNPAHHEAPVVIGHPRHNSPAYGWIEALKREGDVLFAKMKQLAPEFVQWVRQGLYKKRSISLYPDLTLRHVGFLGALPPAVKGLADVGFSQGGGSAMEFMTPMGGATAGERLENKIRDIMQRDSSYDGAFLKRGPFSYCESFGMACKEFPELAQEYAEEVYRARHSSD